MGTEISVLPLGTYPDRTLTLSVFYTDDNGDAHALSNVGVWVANGESPNFGSEVSVSAVGAYTLRLDYDERSAELHFVSDAQGTRINVVDPKPSIELFIDAEETQLLAERDDFSFVVDEKDGIEAYINSQERLTEELEEMIVNYDVLMADAKESGEEQIERLIRLAYASDADVAINVRWGA